MHFDTTGLQRSFVHSSAMSLPSRVPRCIRFSSSESAQTRRPSARNLTRNSKEKQNQHVNTTHYTRRLYILFCKSLSAQGRLPGQMLNTIPEKAKAMTSVLSLTSTDCRYPEPLGRQPGTNSTPKMATSWSISGPLSRGSDVSRYLNMDPE